MDRKNIMGRLTGRNKTMGKLNFVLEHNSCGVSISHNMVAFAPCYFDFSTNRKIMKSSTSVLKAVGAWW